MKQFYNVFSNEKVSPLVTQLSWTHCLCLIHIKEIDKINYYVDQIIKRNLSKRQLEELIKSNEYERIPQETKIKFINQDKLEIKDLVPNPIIIKNNEDYETNTEKALHKLILDNIPLFLKELGNGFTFVDSEYKIKFDDINNYIDLLLFNYKYNCFVVVELKVTELKKAHIGQIEIYMNYIDNHVKQINHDKTIGIIVCKKDNKYVIEYCSDKRIMAREYKVL